MSFVSALKKAFTASTRELSAEYGQNKDFLNAVCASCALVAYADGVLEDSERQKAVQVITGHSQLSKLYQRDAIEVALDGALKHAKEASGRQALAREIDSVKGKPNGANMAEDVYLVALDVASSNSEHKIGDEEQGVLTKIANRLGVDPTKFEF